MTKKSAFGARPKPEVMVDPAVVEAFVANGAEKPAAVPEPEKPAAEVKPKRLTIDIDKSLHKRLRARALEEDTTIAEVVRKLLQDWADR
jgi:predicted HicB family RNase H-like nuclease